MRINGKEVAAEGKTIAQVLRERAVDLSNVAVEKNGQIVPKSQYGRVQLKADDVVEIVSFVGGG